MVTFHFQVGGEPLDVECEHEGRRLLVRAGAESVAFEPEYAGEHLVLLHFEDRVVPAWVARADGAILAAVEGETLRFDRRDAAEAVPDAPDGSRPAPGMHVLKAPMPGTVAKVPACEGTEADADQTLVIVEAMKMEYPVAAPAPCRIERVLVRVGNVVNVGDPLIEVLVE